MASHAARSYQGFSLVSAPLAPPYNYFFIATTSLLVGPLTLPNTATNPLVSWFPFKLSPSLFFSWPALFSSFSQPPPLWCLSSLFFTMRPLPTSFYVPVLHPFRFFDPSESFSFAFLQEDVPGGAFLVKVPRAPVLRFSDARRGQGVLFLFSASCLRGIPPSGGFGITVLLLGGSPGDSGAV